jgi:uncharacterized small protein (DUF1192 family)
MAREPDNDLPRRPVEFALGQDLGLLSETDLAERIVLLEKEIARCRTAIEGKERSRMAADSFFRKP